MRKPLLILLMLGNIAFAQVNLNQGLRAYYPFSGNANDISGNNNNPSFNNATLTADRLGNANSAYHFNGTTNYMRVLNNASLNMTNKMSITAWVRPTGFYTGPCYNNMMVMKGFNDGSPAGNYYIRFSDVYTGCTTPTTTQERFYGTGAVAATPLVQLNQWYCVVWTYDGTTARVYVNCELKQSSNINLSFTNGNDLFMGRMEDPSFPYWLNGDLDEVRIYDRALNQDEINVLGDCTSSMTCNNWLRTQAVGQSVTVGDLDISGNQLTIEGNFNCTAFPVATGNIWEEIVSKHIGVNDDNYTLRMNLGAITTTNGFFRTPPISCDDILLNKTYHAAMVYDGTTLKFYRNGFLRAQIPATGNLILNNLLTTIGDYADNNPQGTNFVGYLNEIKIWNVARTQAQIQAYMNSSLPNPTTQPGLLGYYTFDNLLNKQGNATYNGTLNGGASINNMNPNCSFLADSCPVNATISNIINTYTPVLAITNNSCINAKITVEDASTFNVGDTVMIIQMKGAVVDETNTSAFGSITDYKNSGNYEFNYVKSKSGNVIELRNVMTRSYDVPVGKVQLIRVPYYQNANITATLTCLPWDGNKGGVLVLNVADSVLLAANIDVSGKGFRGGNDPFSNPPAYNCNESQYFYPVNPDLASEKGEGIAIIPLAKSYGKGDVANGGGSGNSHNSGGGGGSNASAGGLGGYNFEGGTCTNVPFDNRGIGGRALTYSNAANKIFMGGGGGAGHSNNPEGFQSNGGNGSGIVIIMADKIKANSFKILANGSTGIACGTTGSGCHEGMGGGGAGGAVLMKINTALDATNVEIKGGKGTDMTAATFGRVGPGGGGSGGKLWVSSPALPANVTATVTAGQNGVCTGYAGDAWGATAGSLGSTLFSLSIPFDNVPFNQNIDSVRMNATATTCNTFDFDGFGYTNTNPITDWHWYFGDGGEATTQNTSHTYTPPGPFLVKLVVTDINGCKDSITRFVNAGNLNFDFTYSVNACSPLTVQFTGEGTDTQNPYWSFGDGNTASGTISTTNTYGSLGSYLVKYSVTNGPCADTVRKVIDLSIARADIIATRDTTICYGATKQLLATSSSNFCWTPTTALNNPLISNPITSTTQPITYYYTAEITGNNLIVNGDLSGGNTGFISEYSYKVPPNVNPGEYFVGSNPQAWNAAMGACTDHTNGSGNMLLVNGASTDNVKVWSQSVTVLPNTNYKFSTWLQSVAALNPARLQFSINGNNIGPIFQASSTNCVWQQFNTNWNSGTNTSIQIAIVNRNTVANGNDFALDDISFAPVSIKYDSVRIAIDSPTVATTPDTPICEGTSLQLNTTGTATIFSWTPATGLSNTGIGNPVATPAVTTQYFVTGTTVNGCNAKDSLWVTINPAPVITKSKDTTICTAGSAQLFATGGGTYSWSPPATLSNPSSPNPVATPSATTLYYVVVTGANTCTKKDSVNVTVRTASSFSINPPDDVCRNGNIQLLASGGDLYSWTPAGSLNNASIPNPVATPSSTTPYNVQITDTICNNIGNLSTTITVLPLPFVDAIRSNDIDCSIPQSQLSATGALTYSWSPAVTLNNPNIPDPVATPLTTTEYIVTGTDAAGCSNSDKVTVKVSPIASGGYLMPTGFTPNNDGKNDCYGVKNWGIITQLEFSIYNRWGERIFFTTDASKCWDGTYKGVPQDPDVFVFMVKAKTTCQPEVFRKGTFVLIR